MYNISAYVMTRLNHTVQYLGRKPMPKKIKYAMYDCRHNRTLSTRFLRNLGIPVRPYTQLIDTYYLLSEEELSLIKLTTSDYDTEKPTHSNLLYRVHLIKPYRQ